MQIQEFDYWKQNVIKLREESTFATITPETEVLIAPVKNIKQEYRFFVVNHKIVTGSRYKVGTRVIYTEAIEQDAIDYAQYIADIWGPSSFYALDIALTEEGFKVLEINCGTSAGFYATNVTKIVEALETMVNEIENIARIIS